MNIRNPGLSSHLSVTTLESFGLLNDLPSSYLSPEAGFHAPSTCPGLLPSPHWILSPGDHQTPWACLPPGLHSTL